MSAVSAASTVSAGTAPTNVCPQCGARFRCGMEGGDKECWCAGLPALLPIPSPSASDVPAASCLCPDCLKARLGVRDQ